MHNCRYMSSSFINNIDDYLASDGLIYFDKVNNAYYVVDGHTGDCIPIEYCPWCGQRLMSIKTDNHILLPPFIQCSFGEPLRFI